MSRERDLGLDFYDRDRRHHRSWFSFRDFTPDYREIVRLMNRGPAPCPPGPVPPCPPIPPPVPGALTGNPFMSRIITASGVTALLPTDLLVEVNTSLTSGIATLTLPAQPPRGTTIAVQDIGGSAFANNILINTSLGDYFGTNEGVNGPGSPSVAGQDGITANYGGRTYSYDGAKWHVWARNNSGINGNNGRATVTSNVSLTPDDTVVPFNGGQTFTLTMPTNPRPGQVIILKEVAGLSSGVMTLTAAAGQKIQEGGATSTPSAAGGSLTVRNSGSSTGVTALVAYQYYEFVYDVQNLTWWGLP